MFEKIDNSLQREIYKELENLKNLTPGSEEHAQAVESLKKLFEIKVDDHNKTEKKFDRYFKYGIASAEILLPLMFYAYWMRKGFKFEETGTITSNTFRNLINKFRPTK